MSEGVSVYALTHGRPAGTINAPAADVYDLLRDSSRVAEYNNECDKIHELAALDEDTKVPDLISSNLI